MLSFQTSVPASLLSLTLGVWWFLRTHFRTLSGTADTYPTGMSIKDRQTVGLHVGNILESLGEL